MPLTITTADNIDRWHITDYLQNDVKEQGLLDPDDIDRDDGPICSFWFNINYVMDRKSTMLIAKNDEKVMVGYVVLDKDPRVKAQYDGRDLEIQFLEVLKPHRRQGLGREMVSWVRVKARASGFLSLNVLSTEDALEFWTGKLGFDRVTWHKERVVVSLAKPYTTPRAKRIRWQNSGGVCEQCHSQLAVLTCSKCEAANYCSERCQREAWTRGGHGKRCRDE